MILTKQLGVSIKYRSLKGEPKRVIFFISRRRGWCVNSQTSNLKAELKLSQFGNKAADVYVVNVLR